uniref:C2H2-type domain-containing protein n=1 Tax=Strigamia maritima TaxID=126957 RepID=T1JL74_STRMM
MHHEETPNRMTPKKCKKPVGFKCTYPNCNYRSERKFDFDGHERIHTNEKPFACRHCEYKGRLKSYLRRHVEKEHEKCLKCDICNFTTTDGKKWRLHSFTHAWEKPFGCNFCGFVCKTDIILKKHVRTHAPKLKYACNECEEEFESKSELNSHGKTHLKRERDGNEKLEFRCSQCEYRTNLKRLLPLHVLVHSKKRNFKCWLCHFECKRERGLRLHLRRKHDTELSAKRQTRF